MVRCKGFKRRREHFSCTIRIRDQQDFQDASPMMIGKSVSTVQFIEALAGGIGDHIARPHARCSHDFQSLHIRYALYLVLHEDPLPF